MPRSKTFSVESALDQVTELLLEHGYAALTGREIGEDLGVSRSTIYVTFGSKRAMFVRALRRYGPARVPGLSELRDAPSPRAALARVFELVIAAGRGKQQRCLVLNTLLDIPAGDPEVVRLVEDAVQVLEERFREAIERGRCASEIAAGVDPVQTARVLLSLYLGIYVLIRSGAAGDPVLHAVLQQVQALLPATSVAGADE